MIAGRTSESVSVVIGAYNAAPWIGETLDSVLAQTHRPLEVLVVDDGSTDETANIVRSRGSRVKCITSPHRGYPQRNKGIQASAGEWIAFVDADDAWQPNKIERQLQTLRERRAAWVYSDSVWLDSELGVVTSPKGPALREGDILEALCLGNFVVASSAMVSRAVLNEVGQFVESPEIVVGEDWDLWLRIASRYPVACVREPLVTLRLHAASLMAATSMHRRVESLQYVVARAVRRDPARLGRIHSRARSNIFFSAGIALFRQQQNDAARPYFRRSWGQTPFRLEALAYAMLAGYVPKAAAYLARRKRRPAENRKPPEIA